VDRIGLYEHFWSDTRQAWIENGDITEETDLIDHFDFDIRQKRRMPRQYAQVTESPGYRDTLHIIAEDCSLKGYYFERVCSRQCCYPF